MIEVIGEEGSNEYSAALSIAEAIGNMWPGVKTSPTSQDHIRISADVKISGYRVSDIDVVVCAVFHRERKFIPRRVIHDKKGKRIIRKPVRVQNFVVVIEVKDHPESRVQIIGDKISVKYSRGAKSGWKSATDQNVNQVHSLQPYLKDLGYDIYVHRCVFMRGITHVGIGGAIASGFDGVDFFTAIASISNVGWSVSGYTLSSGSDKQIIPILNAPIFKPITPTALDRKRMDMIATNTPESEKLLAFLGNKMVSLRGHGGTGKTVMFLQMAWKAFDERGLRTLVLTYNHALAADIRRLLALLKVPSNPEEGGIAVNTAMSFMYSWFFKLQLIDKEDVITYESYDSHCQAALELIEGDAILPEDIEAIIKNDPDRFDFDCVVVDEAQDWPQGEVDMLKALYPPHDICIADGIDQLVRGERPDWERGVDEEVREVITHDRCLRMKRNLAVFVNQVADVSSIKWKVTPNDMAGGGRVIILKRPYFSCNGLHEKLIEDAKSQGNAELDFLFCVPPASVVTRGPHKESDIGNFLSKAGYQVWDGVDEFARKDFPRSRNQFRIVQYASCRGLEGWTIVLHNADQYWGECKEARRSQGLATEEELAFEDIGEIADRQAWHRILIAFTRPIDTMVISLNDTNSPFSIVLLDVASKFPEFIEVIE